MGVRVRFDHEIGSWPTPEKQRVETAQDKPRSGATLSTRVLTALCADGRGGQ